VLLCLMWLELDGSGALLLDGRGLLDDAPVFAGVLEATGALPLVLAVTSSLHFWRKDSSSASVFVGCSLGSMVTTQ
jgi:hypothetical protein